MLLTFTTTHARGLRRKKKSNKLKMTLKSSNKYKSIKKIIERKCEKYKNVCKGNIIHKFILKSKKMIKCFLS